MAFFMSVSVSDELQLFAQEIQSFLSPNTLRDLARDVGFVQRTSKYQAKDLVALCIWMSQNIATTSLTQLCSQLETSTGVLLSPEGLNRRFNSASVSFFRNVFTTLLQFLMLFLLTLSVFLSLILQHFKCRIDLHLLILVPEDVVIQLV